MGLILARIRPPAARVLTGIRDEVGTKRTRSPRAPGAIARRFRVQEQEWAQVVAAATRAPSIHNTQPWRFIASDSRLELYFDEHRALPVLDPTRRQQVISCGIAVEFAAVALAAAGFAAEADLLPDDAQPDHLATLRVTGPHEVTALDTALVAAIERRHTVRAPFLSR